MFLFKCFIKTMFAEAYNRKQLYLLQVLRLNVIITIIAFFFGFECKSSNNIIPSLFKTLRTIYIPAVRL